MPPARQFVTAAMVYRAAHLIRYRHCTQKRLRAMLPFVGLRSLGTRFRQFVVQNLRDCYHEPVYARLAASIEQAFLTGSFEHVGI